MKIIFAIVIIAILGNTSNGLALLDGILGKGGLLESLLKPDGLLGSLLGEHGLLGQILKALLGGAKGESNRRILVEGSHQDKLVAQVLRELEKEQPEHDWRKSKHLIYEIIIDLKDVVDAGDQEDLVDKIKKSLKMKFKSFENSIDNEEPFEQVPNEAPITE